MSRLDRHVSNVQNKLTVQRFVHALAWVAFALGVAALIAVIIYKSVTIGHNPAARWWWIGGGIATVGAAVFAISRRPSARDAAVAIDQKLNLHEKFSTALYVRPSKDPFAQATVRDAEQTADIVRLDRQFPVAIPRIGYAAALVVAMAFGCGIWMTKSVAEVDASTPPVLPPNDPGRQADARKLVAEALAVVSSAPPSVAQDAKIAAEREFLKNALKAQTLEDPSRISRKAKEALEDVQQALADEAEKTRTKSMAESKQWAESFGDPSDYKSDVNKVDSDLAKSDFKNAVADLGDVAKKFEKMTEEEKKQTADEMGKLAKKLEAAGEDPKVQKEIEQKLKDLGATPQQAQQMSQAMQQAAQGDKQAQQQVAQAAQQMQQQLQQQIQQLQQQAAAGNQQAQQQVAQAQSQMKAVQSAIQGMQGQANSQAQAQQMGQAAAQMSQAMQQQAAAGQNGQQGQTGQQGTPSPQAAQQMAAAQGQMQQAMQSMQAAQADAQAVAAAQQAAMNGDKPGGQSGKGQGQGQGQGAGQGQDGQGGQSPPGGQGKAGEYATGDPEDGGQGGGSGGPSVSAGGINSAKAPAGFALKPEQSIGDANEKGIILANTLIKDNKPLINKSKLGLTQITESVEKQASDEVDEDHVSGQSRKAAEEYFRTMHQDAGK